MIFVTLGTQDKGFPRLLEAIDKQIEKGNIKEKVIVQAGLTEYESDNMKIFDLVPQSEFDNYIDEASLIITHGGAGSILTAVKKGKKVIAAARLAKYKEHNNDHQLQIVKEFSDKGYILELDDFDQLDKVLKKAKTFKPKKYISNTKHIEELVTKYIEDYDNISWFNKYRLFIIPVCFIILNILLFSILNIKLDLLLSSFFAYIICTFFAFLCKDSSYSEGLFKKIFGFFKYFIYRIDYLFLTMLLVLLFNSNFNFSDFFINLSVNIIISIFAIIFNIIYRNIKV